METTTLPPTEDKPPMMISHVTRSSSGEALPVYVPAIEKLAAALAKAQGLFPVIPKTKKVDFVPRDGGQRVKYNYADLADIMDAVRKPLCDNSLSITHHLEPAVKAGYVLITTLLHASGQRLTTPYPLPDPALSKPQVFGGLMTYARRYSVSALLGIASEDDIDGADGEGDDKPEKKKSPTTPPPAAAAAKAPVRNEAPASKTSITQIANLAEARSIAPGVLGLYLKECYQGVTSVTMKKFQADEIIQLLERETTGEATLMAAVSQAQTKREINQGQPR